jgi:N-methylhydantoinase B
VLRDVAEGKVSLAAAHDDYGVVLVPGTNEAGFTVDDRETAVLRERLRAQRGTGRPVIDRGDGFERMLRGEIKPWIRTV